MIFRFLLVLLRCRLFFLRPLGVFYFALAQPRARAQLFKGDILRTAVLALDPTLDTNFEGDVVDESVWKIWGKPTATYNGETYVGFDAGVIRADQVTQRDGELIVSMTKRDTPKTFKSDKNQVVREWNTGWVSLQLEHGFCEGAYEADLLIPAVENLSAGVWCGVWSRPFDGSIGGEIDGAESFGHGGTDARHSVAEGFTSTVHFDQTGKNHKAQEVVSEIRPLSTDFHKVGVYKTADEIVIYFDREEVHRVARADDPAVFDAAFPVGVPFDVRFCIQAGGSWGGYPNEGTASRSELRVRRVRIWNFDK